MKAVQHQGGRFIKRASRAVPKEKSGFHEATGGETHIVTQGNKMLAQFLAVHG